MNYDPECGSRISINIIIIIVIHINSYSTAKKQGEITLHWCEIHTPCHYHANETKTSIMNCSSRNKSVIRTVMHLC